MPFRLVNYSTGTSSTVRLSDFTLAAAPDSVMVTRGVYVSGNESSLRASYNVDYSVGRSPSDVQSRTEFDISSVSPIATPTRFEFKLEGSVFARSNVVQTIELFDYVAAVWVLVDTRNAVRSPMPDSVVTVSATGDLSRFVESTSMNIKARIQYRSDNPRQTFRSNTDQAIWMIQ